MVDLTKYLWKLYSFPIRSHEQIFFMQPKLNEQVIMSKIKDIPDRIPLQNISVFPKMRVGIFSGEHARSNAPFSLHLISYHTYLCYCFCGQWRGNSHL